MSSTSDLAEFAGRLLRFIRASTDEGRARTPLRAASTAMQPRCEGAPNVQRRAAECAPCLAEGFDELALQLFALQFAHNGPYRQICSARGVKPSLLTHWTEIPAVPTRAFKELDVSCLPEAERTHVFLSSGTTGQTPSRHFHNAQSLAMYEASLLPWLIAHLSPRNLAILTPPLPQASQSSLVHMFDAIRRSCGLPDSVFLGRAAEGVWSLDLEAAVEVLHGFCAAREPLAVLGTAFSFVHLLDHLAERGLRLRLPDGSSALETGGYKGRSRALPKEALHALITQRLGIPPTHIVCEYGMSELSSQAYDAAVLPSRFTHHVSRLFRFPPWARVQVISPETGREAGEGETGLIRVLDLANVYSVMAIQTEDLGIRRRDGFELIGRAALAEPRGCSLTAA